MEVKNKQLKQFKYLPGSDIGAIGDSQTGKT